MFLHWPLGLVDGSFLRFSNLKNVLFFRQSIRDEMYRLALEGHDPGIIVYEGQQDYSTDQQDQLMSHSFKSLQDPQQQQHHQQQLGQDCTDEALTSATLLELEFQQRFATLLDSVLTHDTHNDAAMSLDARRDEFLDKLDQDNDANQLFFEVYGDSKPRRRCSA